MDKLGYGNILQNSIENILLAEKQVQDKGTESRHNVYEDLEQFWKEIDAVSKKLSFECTKLCICFSESPPPSTEETSGLLQGIESSILTMVSVVYRLDPSFGRTLHQNVIAYVVGAAQAARQLIRVIKDDGGEEISERYRRATGVAWEGCKSLENSPKDNKHAVLARLKEQGAMVSDALNEITEALKGDGSSWDPYPSDSEEEEPDPTWSDQDKLTLDPTVKVIKAAKALYTKIIASVEKSGSCDAAEERDELDQLLEDCNPISQMVDCLVLELYPPLGANNMNLQTQALASYILTALKMAVKSHFTTEEERPAVEFIQTAVNHNLDRMKQILRVHLEPWFKGSLVYV